MSAVALIALAIGVVVKREELFGETASSGSRASVSREPTALGEELGTARWANVPGMRETTQQAQRGAWREPVPATQGAGGQGAGGQGTPRSGAWRQPPPATREAPMDAPAAWRERPDSGSDAPVIPPAAWREPVETAAEAPQAPPAAQREKTPAAPENPPIVPAAWHGSTPAAPERPPVPPAAWREPADAGSEPPVVPTPGDVRGDSTTGRGSVSQTRGLFEPLRRSTPGSAGAGATPEETPARTDAAVPPAATGAAATGAAATGAAATETGEAAGTPAAVAGDVSSDTGAVPDGAVPDGAVPDGAVPDGADEVPPDKAEHGAPTPGTGAGAVTETAGDAAGTDPDAEDQVPEAGAEDSATGGTEAAAADGAEDGTTGSTEDAAGGATGSAPEPSDDQQVTVVPGVPRYHRARCILIRFMGDDDLELTTLAAARTSGCTPCRACQPDVVGATADD